MSALAVSTALAGAAASGPGEPVPAKVSLETDDQVKLAATYYPPPDSKQKYPGAVLVHDVGGSRADLNRLATRLQKSGFAVLTLDLRGHGESATGELTWAKLDTDGQLRTWDLLTRDVKSGVKYLTSQPNVSSSTVSLVGHGAGCILAVRHAIRDEKVRDLVLLAPKTDHLGSSLVHDLAEIPGLPTYIAVGKDEAPAGKRIAEFANRSGEITADTEVSKVDNAELLGDAKLAANMSRWMQSKVQSGVQTIEAKAGR